MSRLARVRSFWRLCHSAAAPRSKGRAWPAASGSEPVAVGDWARTDEDRIKKGDVQSKARKTDGTRLLKRNRILPPRLGSREATAAELRTASDKTSRLSGSKGIVRLQGALSIRIPKRLGVYAGVKTDRRNARMPRINLTRFLAGCYMAAFETESFR